MSRGYGTTYGLNTNDNIIIPFITFPIQYTFMIWFYYNPGNSNNLNMRLLDATVSGGSLSWTVQYNPSTALLTIGTGWTSTGGAYTAPTPSKGAWHCLVVSYDGSSTANKPTVYSDGQTLSVTTVTTPAGSYGGTTTNNSNLGNNGAVNRTWDGMLSYATLWSTILTPAETALLSTGLNPLIVRPDSMIFCYPLDGVNSPEVSYVGNPTTTISGTAKGISDPFVQPIGRIRSLYDALSNSISGSAFKPFFAHRSIPFIGKAA